MKLLGMDVIVSDLVKPVPVLQLSPDFNAVSPEFKAQFNQWLLERFGTKDVMFVIGNKVAIHPKHYKILLENLRK